MSKQERKPKEAVKRPDPSPITHQRNGDVHDPTTKIPNKKKWASNLNLNRKHQRHHNRQLLPQRQVKSLE